ncbi:rhomboid family intramembrane serine protease [Flavobacterium rakeshii]|uniref:Rhomboid family intramembrane serine protease n=1 Tax=Flavobacterium rakeshii TaxID=1038845 RepID=A0A6N8HEL4_9FLAO|nr:rhomboid family intramembrane serine protease [Flavobacterium rakeshii]MUV03697.1 rhomboid family intramembrane serine protease [Flavobacterium rakeshii]
MINNQQDNQFKFSPSVLAWPLYFVLLLWIVFWADGKFHLHLTEFGIYPRTLKGLRGIVFSPFLHGSLEHLYNNSIPLLVLIAGLRYFYRKQALQVLVYGVLLSGFITWLIGRESYHIGASGLIYVLVSFMFFKGMQSGYYRLVALSLLIVMFYGGMIWYVFPDIEEGISWEGHLGGLITGILFSRIYSTPQYKKQITYDWQRPDFDPSQDPFMKRFDENGNFVNPPKPEPEEELTDGHGEPVTQVTQGNLSTASHTHNAPVFRIVYNYIPIPAEEEGGGDIEEEKAD